MTHLEDLAKVVRSKNAGPFALTIDLLFESADHLERAAAAPDLSVEAIAAAYGLRATEVTVLRHDASLALKVTFRRSTPSGALDDRDLYGAQQHVPLLEACIP